MLKDQEVLLFIQTEEMRTYNYEPADEPLSSALYGTDSRTPDKPLPVNKWIEITGADNIYIDYTVQPEGDVKICWAITDDKK